MQKLIAAILFIASCAHAADNGAITKALEAAIAQSGIPGAAIVAVDRNGVIYSANFGSRDLEAELPVTNQTMFYLASATKPFTALTAMLTLDIDAPLETVLPDLHLNRTLSVRDLLTHRLGFANDAVTFRTAYSGEIDRATLFELLQSKSTTTPREFKYSNLGYVITGYAMGGSWKDEIAKRVLEPLGMHNTTTHAPAANAEVAVPYVFDGDWRRVASKSEKTMHAAGGMFATASDLALFIRMSLNRGGGMFAKRLIDETQSPQIHLKRRFGRFDRFAYGLGWYLADYDGDLLIHHFGNFRGAESHLSFMPEHGIGVVVLMNSDVPLAHSFAAFVYDSLLKKPDAQKRLDEDVQRFVAAKSKRAASLAARVEKEIAIDGTYAGDYGTIVVAGNKITLGEMTSDLVPANGSTFVVHFAPDEPTLATFYGDTINWDGQEFRRSR